MNQTIKSPNEHRPYLSGLAQFAIILLSRGVWHVWPLLLTCVLFWLAFWGLLFLPKKGRQHSKEKVGIVALLSALVLLAGAALNTVVTLANGGFMPVVGEQHGFSIWVTATDRHNLLFLADRFGGFSLGDFLILGGSAGILAARGFPKNNKGMAGQGHREV